MYDKIISLRNTLLGLFYQSLLKPVFFRIEPEIIHDRMVACGVFFGKYSVWRNLTGFLFSYSNKKLEQEILGIKFKNPIGLAAGFDKNGELCDILPHVGFGFAEIGSITGEPCEGNPKPRIWRLKNSKGLLVYYGLKNDGCEVISNKLKNKQSFSANKKNSIPIGTNIAKTNNRETVQLTNGINDYAKAFRNFTDIGAYYTINISCPNAYGGQPFTDAKRLDLLLRKVDKIPTKKPIFLKLSPDLSKREVDGILAVSKKHKVHGFICTNLTKNRKNKKILEKLPSVEGGMSGKVVQTLSDDLISYVYKKTKGNYVIIGLGGVFCAEDAYRKIKLGASLVQLITGMIFEGPQVISEINQGLVRLLEKDGFNNISEAIGADFR